MKAKTTVLIAATVVFATAIGLFICLRSGEKTEPSAKKPLVSYKRTKPKKLGGKLPSKVSKEFAVSESAVKKPKRVARPEVDDDVDENGVKLSQEMKQILADLQDCMDRDDRKKLTKICERIQAIQRERGVDAVPVSVRSAAVEAIGIFLPESLSELVGFMADSDADVLDSVINQLDNVLNDTTIGDREISTVFTSISKVLTNADAVDSMVLTIEGNMRNSVKVQTYKTLLDTGTPEVISRLKESIAETLEIEPEELPEDKESIKKKLTEWQQDNPDGEDDDDLYNGV